MKHDHSHFRSATPSLAAAYGDRRLVEDRVRRFMPMVRKAAWHIYGSGREGFELEDLIQAGLVALTECARKHQGPGEDGFAAYAKIRVRGAMLDLLRRMLPNSRLAAERRRQIRDKREELAMRLGRPPHGGELAAAMGLTEGELAEMENHCEPVRLTSLDSAYDDQSADYADERPQAFEMLADAQLRDDLALRIAELPERLKMVLQLYFVEEMNLAEIAAILEVSVPRVHQLKAQAIERLRAAMANHAEFFG